MSPVPPLCCLLLLCPVRMPYAQGVWRLDEGGPKVATSEIYAEAEAEAAEEEE